MSDATRTPKPFRVRKASGGDWEVEFARGKWLRCDSEEDARTLADAPILEYGALAGTKSGCGFASELERAADVLELYGMRFGSRFFRYRAQKIRRAADGQL